MSEIDEELREAVYKAILEGFEELSDRMGESPKESTETETTDLKSLQDEIAELREEVQELQGSEPTEYDLRGIQ